MDFELTVKNQLSSSKDKVTVTVYPQAQPRFVTQEPNTQEPNTQNQDQKLDAVAITRPDNAGPGDKVTLDGSKSRGGGRLAL